MFIDKNNYKHNNPHIITLSNIVKNFQMLPGFEPYLPGLILNMLTT